MSLQACANIVHQADPARWRAVMAAPVASREKMLPIYAANIEISRAPWVTQEPFIALMRLQWWRDALGELQAGTPRRHEVVDALATLPANVLAPLDAAIDARQADVDKDAFKTPEDLAAYARDTTYGAMAACHLALGGAATDVPKILDLATALGLSRVLQAALDLKGSGWRIFPTDWSDDQTIITAKLGLAAWNRSADLRAQKSAAFIESAGADLFLKAVVKRPSAVQDGSLPGYPIRSAIARARYAFSVK